MYKTKSEKKDVEDFFTRILQIENDGKKSDFNEKFLSEEFKEFYYKNSLSRKLFNTPDE